MYKLKSIEDFGNSYRVTFTPTNKEVVFDVLKHKSDLLFQNLSEVADSTPFELLVCRKSGVDKIKGAFKNECFRFKEDQEWVDGVYIDPMSFVPFGKEDEEDEEDEHNEDN